MKKSHPNLTVCVTIKGVETPVCTVCLVVVLLWCCGAVAIFIVVTVVVRDVLLKMTHCLLANYRARIMSNMFLLSAFVFVNFLSFYFHLLIYL